MNFTAGCDTSSYNAFLLQDLAVVKTYSPALLVIFCVANIVSAICSSSGNALVFMTVWSFSELHISSNIALASLAAANTFEGLIIHCFCAFGVVAVIQEDCPLSRPSHAFGVFLTIAFVYSGVLNLTLVTFDRYIAVTHSLSYQVILPPQRIVKLIIAIWSTSLLVSVPFLIDDSAVNDRSQNALSATLFMALAAIFYFNFRIHRLSRRQRQQVGLQQQAMLQFAVANQQRHRFRGAKTMLFIFLTLVICFVPALIVRLVKASSDSMRMKVAFIRPWSSLFFGLYCSICPFVYFFRCQELRKYTKKLFRRILNCDCYC